MKTEFIPYEQALTLKELGFDEPCFKVKLKSKPQFDYTQSDYDDFPEQKELEVGVPLYQQAFRWFREKGLNYAINPYYSDTTDTVKYELIVYNIGGSSPMSKPIMFKTHEEAELECLKKLIEIVKSVKK